MAEPLPRMPRHGSKRIRMLPLKAHKLKQQLPRRTPVKWPCWGQPITVILEGHACFPSAFRPRPARDVNLLQRPELAPQCLYPRGQSGATSIGARWAFDVLAAVSRRLLPPLETPVELRSPATAIGWARIFSRQGSVVHRHLRETRSCTGGKYCRKTDTARARDPAGKLATTAKSDP